MRLMRLGAWATAVALVASAVGGFADAQSSAASGTTQTSAPAIALYPGDRWMTVTWEAPADLADGADVTYDIAWIAGDHSGEPDAEWTTITRVSAATGYYGLLGPLENGVIHSVRVRAVTDHAGTWSHVATTTPFERADRSSRHTRPAIPFDVPIGGFLDYSGIDSFKIESSERTGVLVRTSGVRDSQCHLYDSSGDGVPAGYSKPGRGQCRIYAVLDPGTYYLTVTGHGWNSNRRNHGSVFVRLEAVPPTGNSLDTALPVAVGEERFGWMGLDWDGADFWRLDIAGRDFIDVHVVDFYGGGEVSLHDSTGGRQKAVITPLETWCSFQRCHYYNTRLRAELAAGTYYIKVTPGSRWGRSYSLARHVDHEYRNVVTQCEASGRGDGVNDALAGCQWHLDNRGQRGGSRGEDANVAAAHLAGYLGEGVHVAVVDTGIDLGHHDLSANTDPSRSRAYCGSDTAAFRPASDHGTAVAGLVAARDNTIGMRGVTPRATLHNRRLVDSGCNVTGENIADAMTHEMESVCVNTNSWGYKDGSWASPAPLLFDLAIAQGVTAGCGGKGVVYVWSAGNGAFKDDDANLSELANHYGVMAVGAVDAGGKKSNYSETGTNLWVSGPSNVRGRHQPGIATLTTSNRYRTDFGGTSAAAPIVAGVAALVRAANSDLTWRDVKLILAASARLNDPDDARWHEGAAKYRDPDERYWYNRRYGFGVVDAKAAVDLAEGWTNLPPMITQTQISDGEPFRIPDRPGAVSKSVTFDDAIEFVEFVQLDTSFKTPHLRDLRIELISPSGTEVWVLPELHLGRLDYPSLNEPFRFGVARLLGEPAQGAWTLRISQKRPGHQASLDGWGITLYGHRVRPTPAELASVDHAAAGELTVGWSAPAHAGASPVSGYELRHIAADATDRSDSAWTVVEVPGGGDAVSHTITSLEPVPHDVQVRALNGEGAGAWSASMSGTPRSGSNADPVFAVDSVSLRVVENTAAGTAVGDPVTASDDDAGAELTYALSGADAAGFAIDGATGQISASAALDFEAPADSDGDNVYELSVSVSDGLDSTELPDASADDSAAVTVEVLDADEPPVLAAGDCDLTVADWASGDWECVFEATDPEGLAVAWSLSGADAALFEIDAGVLSLAEAADAGSVYEVTVAAAAGDHTVSVDVSLAVIAVNRPPVSNGVAQRLDNALPGFIVSLPVSKADFSDPEGDPLTFTLSVSRDDVHVAGGVGYSDRAERIWFAAKNACALAGLDPPTGDAYYTVVTMTATDPGGATAGATATFRTDPETFQCPSLADATVDGATVTLDFDADLAKGWVLDAGVISPAEPAATEFEVTADGATAALADTDALAVGDSTITLTLASPVTAGQTVTVSYTPVASPVAAAFADRAVNNDTPVPDEPDEPDEPDCTTAPEVATKPTCAAVSGNDLTLTFNRELAAIDAGSAGALIFSFLVEGAYHHGQPVTQSPSRVVVDGSTMTLTLGTPIQPGDDVTVTFFGGTLKDTDGTPVAAFTTTFTTAQRE